MQVALELAQRSARRQEVIFSFGPFRLVPRRQLLLLDGQPVRLGGRAFELLQLLVLRSGELVSKDELMAAAWPDIFVHDSNLKVNMSSLRRSLGDTQIEPVYIATVARRGYKFIAGVQTSTAEVEDDPALAEPVSLSRPPLLRGIVGREADIADIADLLVQKQHVTLAGAGGVGKTTVAVAVARAFASQCRDGVCFVDLATISDPTLFGTALVTALGIRGNPDNSMAAVLDYLMVALLLVIPPLYLVFRSRLQIAPEARRRVLALDAAKSIEDPAEARRTVPILALTILVFFVHKPLHLEPATVALAGAAVTLLVSRQSLHGSISSIEWLTLFFLIGLFVMVGALEHTGALGEVADGIASLTGGDRTAELIGILWVSAIGSGLVDNIPFTAAMIPVVETLAQDDAYWWSLALGACFGGNATIVAAACNVAASGMAARAGHEIGFLAFLRYGLVVTAGTLVLATLYILLRYA